jgi:DNA-directed RNA polymerase III subunit RPC6
MAGEQLSERAQELHAQMMRSKGTHGHFRQLELQELMDIKEPAELMRYAQELLDNKMVSLRHDGHELVFETQAMDEAEKVRGMSPDEQIVYGFIAAAGREGIWTKTIKVKSNLHQHIVLRCLKSLESQRYIKVIKSVKYPTRKIYMLSTLQPSVEVTGGPWFTDSELDSEFIDSLLRVVWQYVARESFPNAFGDEHDPLPQESYAASYTRFPSVTDVHQFVMNSGISTVELSPTDIRSLCEVLVYDDKLERKDGLYRATWHSVVAAGGGPQGQVQENLDGFTGAPCGRCPSFAICEPKGPVNADECIYYDEWLVM